MRRIGIVSNKQRDLSLTVTSNLAGALNRVGFETEILTAEVLAGMKETDLSLVISVGGDGTLIAVARAICDKKIPLLGVNKGTMGYLTEVEPSQVDDMALALAEERYSLEERMMIFAYSHLNKQEYYEDRALNDIVLMRFGHSHTVHFEIFVDNDLLSEYDADGLVISTPTGSTAYNLSAGGPLVFPSSSLMILTPVCAHSMTAKSVILPDFVEVKIRVDSSRHRSGGGGDGCYVTCDGTEGVMLSDGDVLTVKKSEKTTRLVRLNHTSFIDILRKKMN